MNMVDLHVHSTRSDGSYTPAELVRYAVEKGLRAFALTDHDTTEGIAEAMEAAKGRSVEVIPGIEFSTEYEGKDIHIVGLYIDYEGEEFQKYLSDFQHSRDVRNHKMCARLQEYGVPVTYEALQAEYPEAILTRAHYAKYLWQKGYVGSMREAFDRYIGDHAPCFLPREKVTPSQAVNLILRSGGVPVLAHPILYHMSEERLEKLVQTLKKDGLVAIEAIYSTYTAGEEQQIRKLAARYRLLISGGSDFHGTTKPGLDLAVGYGNLKIPYEILEKIQAFRKRRGAILFSDMDGTLLNDRKELSSGTKAALDTYLQKGGKLVLSSGR
ncbi:MAG: PHP domain-containing protein, partial [Acetatifactor sp.]|nr:PHP domain-containing protein [Acetatifactor sp.]